MIKHKTGLLFYYTKPHRNSFNALLGAVDAEPALESVKIAFADDESRLLPALSEIVPECDKVVCCFSFFTAQKKDIEKRVKRVRAKFGQDVILVAGGPHATGAPRDTLSLGFDVAVRGDGEEALTVLLRRINADENYSGLNGIAFIDKNGGCQDNGISAPIDINRYLPFSNRFKKMGSLEITRGCPFGCHYCQVSGLSGRKLRHRSLESIREYAKALAIRSMRQARLLSPNAFSYGSPDGHKINLAAMENMMETLKSVIGPKAAIFFGGFPSEVRPEFVNRDTLALVKRYAANKRLVIGAQSGSDRMLKVCHRGHTIADVYVAVEATVSMELLPVVDFIFSLPGEEKEDARETIKAMRDLSAMGAIIHAHTFMPLPGTVFEGEKVKRVRQEIRQAVEKELLPKGKLFGFWQKQERFARVGE